MTEFSFLDRIKTIFEMIFSSTFFISLFISSISPSVSVVKYARNSYREAEKEIIIFSGGCKKRFF